MQNLESQFLNAIHEEKTVILKLTEILKHEQAIVLRSNLDELVHVTEEKSQLIQKVTELTQSRYILLKQSGFNADESGMQQFIESQSDDILKNFWNELREHIFAAKEVNRVNGLLIGKLLTKNTQALQLLNNQHRNSGVYGPDGQTTRSKSKGISV